MTQSRDAQCPNRPPGLSHTQDGSHICIHCGEVTYDPTDGIDQLRALSIEGTRPKVTVRLVSVTPTCENCQAPIARKRDRYCDDCRFMRRVQFQTYRYQQGYLTEHPPVLPTYRESAGGSTLGIGSLDDWSAAAISAVTRPL